MLVYANKSNTVKIAFLFAFGLSGYALISGMSALFGLENRLFSIAYRSLYIILSIIIIISSFNSNSMYRGNMWFPILLFWLLYGYRLIYEGLLAEDFYTTNSIEWLMVGFGTSFIPMLAYMRSYKEIDLIFIQKVTLLIASCALFINLYIIITNNILAGLIVGSGRANTEYLNPISFGHLGCSVILLTLGCMYTCKLGVVGKLIYTIVILSGFSMVAISASRGPLLGLVLGSFVYMFAFISKKNLIRYMLVYILLVIIGFISLYLAEEYLGFLSISRIMDFISGENKDLSANIRKTTWEGSIMQFMNNPILGDSLVEKVTNYYPHNVIIESFLATGIFGGLIFCFILIASITFSIRLVRLQKTAAWIVALYVQYFSASLLSGALWGNYQMWYYLAAIVGLSVSLKTASEGKNGHRFSYNKYYN